VVLLEPLGPGVELAQAYAELAARSMLLGHHEAAIENARRAQSIAEQAGAPAVISDALNTEAMSASMLGREWAELGASAVARLTRQRLRALGVRSIPAGPRSATREDPLGLTRREREVLEEICAGQTNAAIAAKLFISAKTVDHHVSAMLAKLGAPNRNAAAARAAKLGLLS
jgi:DNA-binding NarL/FixJ family response regulator